jgi:hypothetical protein
MFSRADRSNDWLARLSFSGFADAHHVARRQIRGDLAGYTCALSWMIAVSVWNLPLPQLFALDSRSAPMPDGPFRSWRLTCLT